MTTQPGALRLADDLNAEWHSDALNYDTALEAAAELRRLHAEVEHLKSELAMEQCISFRRQMQQYAAINAQLLEALEYHQEQTRPIQKTIDAIAAAKEQ